MLVVCKVAIVALVARGSAFAQSRSGTREAVPSLNAAIAAEFR